MWLLVVYLQFFTPRIYRLEIVILATIIIFNLLYSAAFHNNINFCLSSHERHTLIQFNLSKAQVIKSDVKLSIQISDQICKRVQ